MNVLALKKFLNLACMALSVLLVAPVGASAQSLSVVHYSKEDLAAASNPTFIKATDLSDLFVSKISLIAVALTSRQGGNNVAIRDVATSAAQKSKAAYGRGMATMTLDGDAPDARVDSDKLRVTLSQQTRKATEVKFKDAFPIFERIRKGLTFQLDVIHSRSKNTAVSSGPTIRYGLVETDIVSDDSPIDLASNATMEEMGAGYSRPSKVVYTIDRLDAYESSTVFAQPATVTDSEIGTPAPQNVDMWSRSPSSKMDVTIDAADQNAAVSDSVGQAKAPGARVTMTQIDGFVSVQAVSTDVKNSRTTTLKAPLYGQMSLSRKMNSKWQTTETAATNILGDTSRPCVNVVYAHVEKKVRGEVLIKKDRTTYTITAEPRQGWGSNGENKLGRVNDKISVGMNTSF